MEKKRICCGDAGSGNPGRRPGSRLVDIIAFCSRKVSPIYEFDLSATS